MTTQEEFFQKHQVDGVLPQDRMAELLLLPVEGDSGVKSPQGGEPEPTPLPTAAPAAGAPDEVKDGKEGADAGTTGAGGEVDPTKMTADNTVILAKDGKHTISFDKLEEAREAKRVAEEQAATAAAETERLRKENEALRAATPAATPAPPAATAQPASAAGDPAKLLEGVDFGDYSDAAMANAVAQLVDKRVAAAIPAIEEKYAAPAAKAKAEEAVATHYATIYTAVPEADSIAQSQEFSAWIGKQPAYAQKAIAATLAEGSATEIVEVFSSYKTATGLTGAAGAGGAGNPDPTAEAAAAAAAAIAATKAKGLTSLSDLPAGTKAHHDAAEAMLAQTQAQALHQFMGQTPDQIMANLNKVL